MQFRLGLVAVAIALTPACALSRTAIGASGGPDTASIDGGGIDARIDSGRDAGDVGVRETGPDMNLPDTAVPDMGPPDVGPPDMGPPDMGPPDMGPPDMGTDVGIDAFVRPDMGTDVGIDAFVPPDVGTDVGTDVGIDAFVPPDVGTDVGIDAFVPPDMGPCAACTVTQMCCSLMCFDTRIDVSHCGSCNPCAAVPNATPGCTASTCVISACSGAFRDCNTMYVDGCEIDTSTSFANCGACGRTCHGTQTCTAGRCVGWAAIATTAAPVPRTLHTAVWTGTQMIVWGGADGAAVDVNTGGVYDPATDTWTATSTTGAPTARHGHAAVWTGSRMIVWAGYGSGTGWVNDGAIYDPVGNTWSPLNSATPSPTARSRFAYAWDATSSRLVIFGGWANSGELNDGAYHDGTRWTAMPGAMSPTMRRFMPGVWTGSTFVIWGGDVGPNSGLPAAVSQTGSRWTSVGNTWATMTNAARPAARSRHVGVWTGSRMVVWSGWDAGAAVLTSGGRYDPVGDAWSAMAMAPIAGRVDGTGIWTTSTMAVWGGADGVGGLLGDGAAYDPVTNTWQTLSTANAPTARSDHSAIWTGSEMIVWGGADASGAVATGARMTPP